MSGTEENNNIIQTKPKRVYKKRKEAGIEKEVVPIDDGLSPSSGTYQRAVSLRTVDIPKRKPRTKKSEPIPEVVVQKVTPPIPEVVEPIARSNVSDEPIARSNVSDEPIARSNVSDEPIPKQKKERTPKQMEAFLKMQEARLQKQQEVKMLKKIEKEKARLEEEENKVEELITIRRTKEPYPYGQQQSKHTHLDKPIARSNVSDEPTYPIIRQRCSDVINTRQVSNQPKYVFL